MTKQEQKYQQKSSEQIKELQETEFKKQMQDKLDEEIKNNSKRMWLTDKFVDKPFIILLIFIILFISCTGITIAIKAFELSQSHDREFLVWDNERTIHFDMLTQAQQDFLKSQQDEEIPLQTIQNDDWTTFPLIHNPKKENILTVDYIKALKNIENKLTNLKDYPKFCLIDLDDLNNCSKNAIFSFTNLFDDIDNLTQQQIDDKLLEIVNDNDLFITYKGFFSNDFSKTNRKSFLIRSMFFMGGPIEYDNKRYKDIFDNESDQLSHFQDFTGDVAELLEDNEDELLPKNSNSKLYFFSSIMPDYYLEQTVNTDFLFAFGSIVFVLIYKTFHLKSFFLASMSMLSIIFSFPITAVIYKGIFQISYFSQLHILVVFIVLGIAADNVFVFTDAWNQTLHYEKLDDYYKRMAFTFRRASRSMLATSSTTGAAFLATGLSKIMPISSFGFFAGILIPINFLLVISFYPTVLMIYVKHTSKMCVSKKKTDEKTDENQQQEEEHKIVQFFDKQFNTFVNKFKYFILIFFTGWSIFAAIRASKLPALSEPEKFFPDDHRVTISSDLMRYDFHVSGNSDTGITVYQFWGVNGMDRDGVGKWDPEDLGKVIWDDKKDFNLAPKQNQQYLYDMCVSHKDEEIILDGLVECFMIEFHDYVIREYGENAFPVEENDFISILQDFVKNDNDGISYYNQNVIGLFGNELKYIAIKLSSEGVPFQPYEQLNPIYERWEKLIQEVNDNAPQGLKNSYQTALIGWVFMITEREFGDSAISGTIISLAFAFLVLLIVTHNIIISVYSILTIGGIVMSVISIMEMAGWELGVAESIAIVILIGMSVDYVVHLANHYVESVYPDKHRKMQQSLKDLGISIVSGAMTTIGSGIFLFFATLVIFNKFAILIVSTISFSLIYALLFFSALCHSIGPKGETGNLYILFKNMVLYFKGEKKQNKDIKIENNNKQNSVANIEDIENQKNINDGRQIQKETSQDSKQNQQIALPSYNSK